MHIVIVGAGKVGFSLAEKLSAEKHDVFIIDHDFDRLDMVNESLDVQTIKGYGGNVVTLKEAQAQTADLLIAVTDSDEVNVLGCLMGKELGVKKTVARVGNPEYFRAEDATFKRWGIDLVINPEKVAAETIARIVDVPEALNVEYYANGRAQLVELEVPENSPVAGKRLFELIFDPPYLIVAILRNGKFFIPRGDDELRANDMIFLMAKTEDMVYVENLIGYRRQKVHDIIILGGGKLGSNLASILSKRDLDIKLIEKNHGKCQEIASKLNKTLVIHGDGTDLTLLEQEDIKNANLFVAVTGDDKVNILVTLLARHLGVQKTVAQIKRSDYIPLVEKLGVDITVSPRMLAAAAILKYIRRGKILSVTLLEGAKAEILELVAPQRGKVINKPLKDLNLPRGMIVGAISRGGEIIIPVGDSVILPGDLVTIFALPKAVPKVEAIFSGR